MPALQTSVLDSQLTAIVLRSAPLMEALRAVRALGLSSWCIGAGAVRNLVWDFLHGFDTTTAPADVDVVFHDPHDLSKDLEQALQRRLSQHLPGLNWEVVNQAAVHLWFERSYGEPCAPLRSLEEGVGSWPEVATCVGVSLNDSDTLQVLAPHGLDDLFGMVVRWNPTRVSRAIYAARIAQKQFAQRWPRLMVMPA